jgi:hypothetical protein
MFFLCVTTPISSSARASRVRGDIFIRGNLAPAYQMDRMAQSRPIPGRPLIGSRTVNPV